MEFKFKKKYGQNFLQNKSIISKIIDSIKPTQNDLIIEIGPGGGAITSKIKKYNCNIVAYEIDLETQKFLKKLEDNKTKIFYKDFLTSNIHQDIKHIKYNKIYIIGNLPYYITTPIIEKIINDKIQAEEVVIMVQKEVGERFSAKPKTKQYGFMTVVLNYWFNIEKVVDAPKEEFLPVPNVDSIVIKLTRKTPININYEKFITILKTSFKFKRKNLRNNLKGLDLQKIEEILQKNGYDLSNRAEDLPLEVYIDLTNNI